MTKKELEDLLVAVHSDQLSINDAMKRLADLPFTDYGFVKLDWHRELRQGYPEAVFCPGKSSAQLTKIALAFAERDTIMVATKATPENFAAITESIPDAKFYEEAGLVITGQLKSELSGLVAVVSAGTSDIPIAEEAALTAEAMGAYVERIFDVGVAGIHRLGPSLDILRNARAIVVVAGMEGALPSFVAGLVGAPIIAIPTSNGYGASFHGLSALLSMLNSCATGVAVVNIDNGYGGGVLAALINDFSLYLKDRR